MGKKYEFVTFGMRCKGVTYTTMMFGLLNEIRINNKISVPAFIILYV